MEVLAPQEFVALGAARQAAWALLGEEPGWAVAREASTGLDDDALAAAEQVRSAYAQVRDS